MLGANSWKYKIASVFTSAAPIFIFMLVFSSFKKMQKIILNLIYPREYFWPPLIYIYFYIFNYIENITLGNRYTKQILQNNFWVIRIMRIAGRQCRARSRACSSASPLPTPSSSPPPFSCLVCSLSSSSVLSLFLFVLNLSLEKSQKWSDPPLLDYFHFVKLSYVITCLAQSFKFKLSLRKFQFYHVFI